MQLGGAWGGFQVATTPVQLELALQVDSKRVGDATCNLDSGGVSGAKCNLEGLGVDFKLQPPGCNLKLLKPCSSCNVQLEIA